MRDDEIQSRLREVNPWWRAAAAGLSPGAWAAGDRVLRDRDRYDLGYRADVLRDVASALDIGNWRGFLSLPVG